MVDSKNSKLLMEQAYVCLRFYFTKNWHTTPRECTLRLSPKLACLTCCLSPIVNGLWSIPGQCRLTGSLADQEWTKHSVCDLSLHISARLFSELNQPVYWRTPFCLRSYFPWFSGFQHYVQMSNFWVLGGLGIYVFWLHKL